MRTICRHIEKICDIDNPVGGSKLVGQLISLYKIIGV